MNALAETRAWLHSIAVAEAGEEPETLDPHHPEAWGCDPDLIHDRTVEDRL